MSTNIPWPKEIEERAIELRNDSQTSSEIAEILSREFGIKVTRNAVIGKLARRRYSLLGKRGRTPKPRSQSLMPIEPPPPSQHEPPPGGLPLTEALSFHCRFPVGGTSFDEFRFCGGGAIPGSPYCLAHHRICYVPTLRFTKPLGRAYANPPGMPKFIDDEALP